MKNANAKLWEEWALRRKEFEESHTFYCPKEGRIYTIGYVDELNKDEPKGFYGEHFTFKRTDTNEIIHSNNLWSQGFFKTNERNLPEIEFIH